MSYLNSVTIIGFVGADPEQRQARNNNGSKFTVLSVATQRSWKNTDDEWASKTEWHRVCVFRPRLAEYVATTIKKGSHVLVEGSIVSTTYERANGKGKKAKTNKQTFWCIRADVVRKSSCHLYFCCIQTIFTPLHSPLSTLHSPLATLHSPLLIRLGGWITLNARAVLGVADGAALIP